MLYQTTYQHGGDIYDGAVALDFSANTNPLGTPPGVLEAVRRSLEDLHRYPDPYCRRLVEAIAGFEQIPQSYILCGNGASDLIYAYCTALRPRLAVELAPTFSEYAQGLARAGGRVLRYPLRREDTFDLTPAFLAFLEKTRPQAIFLCNPNNPTGRCIPPQLLESVLQFCRRENARLFLDECFLDLTDAGVSMKEDLAAYPELLILKAFTKSYGLAGVRLGYCLCADPLLLARMAEAAPPWNVSSPAQAAGAAALRERQFLSDTRDLIRTERAFLASALQSLGFYVCPSSANYLLLHGKPGLDTALRQRGIAIRNCENYHGLERGWYRIAVRLHAENEQLIAAVRQIAEG